MSLLNSKHCGASASRLVGVDGGAAYQSVVTFFSDELACSGRPSLALVDQQRGALLALRTFVCEPFLPTEKYRITVFGLVIHSTIVQAKWALRRFEKTAGVTRVGPPAEFP
jgi:hypothetical protein